MESFAFDYTDPSKPRTLPDMHSHPDLIDPMCGGGSAYGGSAMVGSHETYDGSAPGAPAPFEWQHSNPDMCGGPNLPRHAGSVRIFNCAIEYATAPTHATAPTCVPDVSARNYSQLGWSTMTGGSGCTDRVDGQCPATGQFLTAVAQCAAQGARLCTAAELDVAIGPACDEDVWSSGRLTCSNGEALCASANASTRCRLAEESLGIRCCANVADNCPLGSVCHSGTSLLSCTELGWDQAKQMTDYGNSFVCAEADELDFMWTCAPDAPFESAVSACLSIGARLCTLSEVLGQNTRFAGCFADQNYIWTASQTDPTGDNPDCPAGEVFVAKSSGETQCVAMQSGTALSVCCADSGEHCGPSTGN